MIQVMSSTGLINMGTSASKANEGKDLVGKSNFKASQKSMAIFGGLVNKGMKERIWRDLVDVLASCYQALSSRSQISSNERS